MVQEVEIKIIDGTNNVLGSLDLTSFDDFPLTFTKGIADINALNTRSGTYSLKFKIPATKNNNKLFDFVNNINTKNKVEILARRTCVVYIQGIQIETGQIKVTESDSDGFYNAVFFGDNTDWVTLMANVNLNELDWRDSVSDFTPTEIANINNSDVDTYDIVYPYIDRNSGTAIANLRPCLFTKAFIDAAFDKIGYTVDSNFFNTPEFKKLAFDFAANFTFDQDAIEATEVNYSVTTVNGALTAPNWDAGTMLGNLGLPSVPNIRTFWRFPNLFTNLIKDNSLIFNTATNDYTVQVTSVYNVSLFINYEWRYFPPYAAGWLYWQGSIPGTTNPFAVRPPNFKWHIVKGNTLDDGIDGTIIYSSNAPVQDNLNSGNILLNAGEKISIILELIDDAYGFAGTTLNAPSLQVWAVRILNGSSVEYIRKGSVTLGDEYALNSVIPQDVSCLDLMQDLKTIFNLYFSADTYRKEVKIEPRDDFFLDISTAEDWTDLIDLSDGFQISYASDYKETLQFRYKEDSKDEYLERWNVINSRQYGKYDSELGTRFSKGTSVIETKLFSPVVQGQNDGRMFTSVIRKEYGDLNIIGVQNTEYNFRLFNILREQQFDAAGNPMRTTSPFVVTVGLSESFGSSVVPMNLNFAGADGLVQTYYAKTISNLLEGGVLTTKANIKLTNYRDIDLRRPIYISAPAEIKGHYIVQKIDKFKATQSKTTKVELLKFQNYVPQPNNPTQLGNVPVSVSNPQGPNATPNPIYIEETINGVPYLIPVYVDSNGNIVPVYTN